MRNSKGITLVALVITVIILLILAGITLNLTVGENGIIRRAIEAGQNYQNSAQYEQEMLDELMKQTDNWIGDTEKPDDESDDRNPYESEFRKLVAEAITNEGVATEVTDADETFITNIGKILQERTKDATATKENIAEGKTAWVNGEQITGTGENINETIQKVVRSFYNSERNTFTDSASKTNNTAISVSYTYDYSLYKDPEENAGMLNEIKVDASVYAHSPSSNGNYASSTITVSYRLLDKNKNVLSTGSVGSCYVGRNSTSTDGSSGTNSQTYTINLLTISIPEQTEYFQLVVTHGIALGGKNDSARATSSNIRATYLQIDLE